MEDKHSKFKRIATKRVQKVLYSIKVLGNLSNRSAYSFTEDDIQKIFKAVEDQVRAVKSKFHVPKSKIEFKL